MSTQRPSEQDEQVGTVERAYQLARSGRCRSVGDIRAELKREGLGAVDSHLAGPSLRRELSRLCLEARPSPDSGS